MRTLRFVQIATPALRSYTSRQHLADAPAAAGWMRWTGRPVVPTVRRTGGLLCGSILTGRPDGTAYGHLPSRDLSRGDEAAGRPVVEDARPTVKRSGATPRKRSG